MDGLMGIKVVKSVQTLKDFTNFLHIKSLLLEGLVQHKKMLVFKIRTLIAGAKCRNCFLKCLK